MRHRNHRTRLNRTSAHRLSLMKNLAKAFFTYEKIVTTVPKAKALRGFVEPLITLAKSDDLSRRRRVIQLLGIRFNPLTSKQKKMVKAGNLAPYNDDRKIVDKLFKEIGPKFKVRPGGYTRIVKTKSRSGDSADCCIIESVE